MRDRQSAQECRLRVAEGGGRVLTTVAGGHRDVLPQNRWPGGFRQGSVASKEASQKRIA